MHIPDGFLSAPVWAALDVAAVPAVGILARRTHASIDDRRIPLLGVLGAFVFAAQMINFPVAAGTSSHLVGGTLLAIALGPSSAAIVMVAIIAIQAFVFQDGGILALGANVFNMAIAGVFAGYLPYRLWGAKHRLLAIFAGATLSIALSAALALSELLISGVAISRSLLLLSIAIFGASAIIEGAITAAVVRAIDRLRPDWIRAPRASRSSTIFAFAALALLIVAIVIASTHPDGIENLLAVAPAQSSWMKKAAAGFFGIALAFVVCFGTAKVLARRRSA